MKTTDLLVTWPTNVDFPFYREFLQNNYRFFKTIFISWHEVPGYYSYKKFIMSDLAQIPNIRFLEVPQNKPGDWRDNAIHEALNLSDSDYVLFMEQDFFILWIEWFKDVMQEVFAKTPIDLVRVLDGDRMHPCFLKISRSLLEQTSKNFAANPPLWDHFGKIQRDLEDLTRKKEVGTITTYVQYENIDHFAGYSHNWRLLVDGGLPNHRPQEYMKKLLDSLSLRVNLDAEYVRVVKEGLERWEMSK